LAALRIAWGVPCYTSGEARCVLHARPSVLLSIVSELGRDGGEMGQDETVDMHNRAGRDASCTFWPSAIARMRMQ
jgi:hypothetical protein